MAVTRKLTLDSLVAELTLFQQLRSANPGLAFALRWLNANKSNPHAAEVEEFIGACQQCLYKSDHALEHLSGARVNVEWDFKSSAIIKRHMDAMTHVYEMPMWRNRQDEGLSFKHTLVLEELASFADIGAESKDQRTQVFAKQLCFAEILDLAASGKIRDVRRCPACGDWFKARTKEHTFCHIPCRRHAYQTSSTARERNKLYQQDRYWASFPEKTKLLHTFYRIPTPHSDKAGAEYRQIFLERDIKDAERRWFVTQRRGWRKRGAWPDTMPIVTFKPEEGYRTRAEAIRAFSEGSRAFIRDGFLHGFELVLGKGGSKSTHVLVS